LKKQYSQYQIYGCAYFSKMPRLEKKCLFSDSLLGSDREQGKKK
jgi:hypothetical protein